MVHVLIAAFLSVLSRSLSHERIPQLFAEVTISGASEIRTCKVNILVARPRHIVYRNCLLRRLEDTVQVTFLELNLAVITLNAFFRPVSRFAAL